ncbi:MAG: efflux RND transporter periplasmic adaptor subunit [Gammaproteobacteria bacterium]
MNRKTIVSVLVAAVLFGTGLAIGLMWEAGNGSATHPKNSTHRILYWANPMDPEQHFNHPGKDSMGMNYVPVYVTASATIHSEKELAVDPRMVQTLGVRLVTVRPRQLGHEIHTVGTVAVDQNRLYDVNLRVSGWVTDLSVSAVGDAVRRGQMLARVYSPELYAAQNEYLIARDQSRLLGNGSIERAAAEKLELLGMTHAQIAALALRRRAQKRMPIVAPTTGTVLALGTHTGGYVTPYFTLFKLANLDRVWVKVALYGYQLPWVALGNPVRLRLANDPAKVWNGRVSFLYPTLNKMNRTLEARLTFDNSAGMLRPGMYVKATLLGTPRTALAIPADAVLRTAEGNYVMVAEGQGHFLPTQVALGPESGGWVEVRTGLKKGNQVAESAQFLLYAESQVQQINARMLGPASPVPEQKPKMLDMPHKGALP